MSLLVKTKHLVLEPLQESDFDDIARLHADADVRRFFPDGIQNRKQTEERMQYFLKVYAETGLPCFVIRDIETNEFIGRCGFGEIDTGEIEVGYLIKKACWNRGYASEALKGLLNWALNNIDSEYIIAFAPIEHTASHRVMEKGGMSYDKEDLGHGVECKFYRFQLERKQ